MSVWRLARTGRWLGALAFTIVFAVACVALGQWQFARRAEARAAIDLLNRNYDRPAVPVGDVLSALGASDPDAQWRPVTVTGKYWTEGVRYVRNRPTNAGVGFEQLAPLVTADGTTLIVDRGWVTANADNSAPATTPALPAGTVTVVSRLIPAEPVIAGRDAPAGQIATIHPATFDGEHAGATSIRVYSNWYGKVAHESPSAATGLPWEKPILDEGPHLSYALQWYVFAVMGFIGWGWALRKEARGEADTPRQPRARRARDEEIEDAALDAMRAR